MTGYKFYLTKSREAANLIHDGLRAEINKANVTSIGSVCVNEDCRIPAAYHNDGWFYAGIEYQGLDRPRYEIIFC